MPSPIDTSAPALDREIVEEIAIEWWVKSATRLKKWRIRYGLTQAQVATACGITPQAVGQIERCVIRPSEPLRWLLADAMSMEPDDIWEPMTREELHRRCANIEAAA